MCCQCKSHCFVIHTYILVLNCVLNTSFLFFIILQVLDVQFGDSVHIKGNTVIYAAS